MKIESLAVRNFRVFKDVQINNIPNLAVFLGENGAGKTTFFDVFGFLHDCLNDGVKKALLRRGGFSDVRSRDSEGPISFELKFRPSEDEPLVTYELAINIKDRQPAVEREVLRLRRGSKGSPWKVLEFSYGVGMAVQGEIRTYEDVQKVENRSQQKLTSSDKLAVDSLGQLREFSAVTALRKLIDDWYVSDFRIDSARARQDSNDGSSLSRTGDNLAVVAAELKEEHPEVFDRIIDKMKERIPGVSDVETAYSEDGYFLLRFGSQSFADPFSAKYVSDGTIKMFAYLVLMADPHPHALLCIEEPENQLYPMLLSVLAEEFREYAERGGQVFVSTHSPDFLNALEAEELFCIFKKDGYSRIVPAAEIPNVRELLSVGDKLGWLWSEGMLTGFDHEK